MKGTQGKNCRHVWVHRLTPWKSLMKMNPWLLQQNLFHWIIAYDHTAIRCNGMHVYKSTQSVHSEQNWGKSLVLASQRLELNPGQDETILADGKDLKTRCVGTHINAECLLWKSWRIPEFYNVLISYANTSCCEKCTIDFAKGQYMKNGCTRSYAKTLLPQVNGETCKYRLFAVEEF